MEIGYDKYRNQYIINYGSPIFIMSCYKKINA